jgi:hypothetical protein
MNEGEEKKTLTPVIRRDECRDDLDHAYLDLMENLAKTLGWELKEKE